MVRKFSLILFIIIFLFNCDLITKSKNKKIKHPSEYTWTIDTLEVSVAFEPAFRPMDILYIDDDDIFIFGRNAHYWDIYFHFDGVKWQDYINSKVQSVYSACVANDKIYGVGTDHVKYDSKGIVASYQNNKWQRELLVEKENSKFNDIIAISEDDIWAGGYKGVLYHFNGSEWEDYCMADTIYFHNFSYHEDHGLYALGYCFFPDNPNREGNSYILNWNGKYWKIIEYIRLEDYDYRFIPFGINHIYLTDEYIYSCGSGVFRRKYNETKWTKLYMNFEATYYDISSSSDDNLYFVGEWGTADHWDGENPTILDSIAFKNVIFTTSWTNGKQVYITGWDFDKNCSYVIHGK